jgi:hypothetical protein
MSSSGFGEGCSGDLCPEGGYRGQPRVEWREDKGGLGRFIAPRSRLGFSSAFQPLIITHIGRVLSDCEAANHSHYFQGVARLLNRTLGMTLLASATREAPVRTEPHPTCAERFHYVKFAR